MICLSLASTAGSKCREIAGVNSSTTNLSIKGTFLQMYIQLKPGVTLLGPEAYHPPPSCAKVRNESIYLRTSDAFTVCMTTCTFGMVGWLSMTNIKLCARNPFKRILTRCVSSCGDTAEPLPDSSVQYDANIVITNRDPRWLPLIDGRHRTQMNNIV